MNNQDQFPVDCLPSIIQDAALEIENNIKAPISLIAASALSVCSLACQHLFSVERPRGQISPVSIFGITIAESGERKSTIDNLLAKPIIEFQSASEIKHESDLTSFSISESLWEEEEKIFKSEFKRQAKNSECTEKIKQKIVELHHKKPQKPKSIKLIYENTSTNTLKVKIHENSKSAALWSPEGGTIFKGQALSDLASLNKMWDGALITVDRSSSESFHLQNANLTISIMVQRHIFDGFIKKHGEEARSTGFFARCLISEPPSTQGYRFIDSSEIIWHHLPIFQERIKEIIKQGSHTSPETHKKTLSFSHEAKQIWIDEFNRIEELLSPGQDYSEIKDFASKIGENIARLAAIFHIVNGESGDISVKSTKNAIAVMQYYTAEFIKIFTSDKLFEMENTAWSTLDWIERKCYESNKSFIKKQTIRQYGPSPVRTKIALEQTLDFLSKNGKINIYKDRTGTTLVELTNTGHQTQQQPCLNRFAISPEPTGLFDYSF